MKRTPLLTLLALILLVPVMGCKPDDEQPKATAKAAQNAAEQMARAEALAVGRALAAAQEEYFRPSPAQAAALEAGLATNPAGTPNGYFTNPEGISGYFQGYDLPFNFIWTGTTAERRTFDGRRLQLVDGPGELILKYAGDELFLQRFKGQFKDGLWEGHGEHWIRNREVGGHNYLHYVGSFRHDRMEGRGVLVNYNFGGQQPFPIQYQGEMSDNAFHGQGLTTDLASGRMLYKGLWLDDQPFIGSRDQWRRAEAGAELNSIGRQYADVLMTDDLVISGFINTPPGQGALTVFLPEGAEKARLIDPAGRSHSAAQIAHPGRKKGVKEEGEILALGVSLELPLSDYPAPLTLSYDRDGKPQLLRLTVKRPCGLELKHLPKPDSPPADQPADAEENLERPVEVSAPKPPAELPEKPEPELEELDKEMVEAEQ